MMETEKDEPPQMIATTTKDTEMKQEVEMEPEMEEVEMEEVVTEREVDIQEVVPKEIFVPFDF